MIPKLELTLKPGTVFLGNGGVEKWLSPIEGHLAIQATAASMPQLRADAPYFDGGDVLLIDDSPIFNFGTADFTIEAWAKRNSPSGAETIIGQADATQTEASISFLIRYTSATLLDFYYKLNGTNTNIAGAVANNTEWHHVAVVRMGGTLTVYNDGVSIVTTPISTGTFFNSSAKVGIGRSGESTFSPFAGQLTDIRIYHVAKYKSNFTPPPRTQCALTAPPLPPIAAITTAAINQFDSGD